MQVRRNCVPEMATQKKNRGIGRESGKYLQVPATLRGFQSATPQCSRVRL